jgi:hypothetical protein
MKCDPGVIKHWRPIAPAPASQRSMTMDRDELLALAERCEKATGADREVDLAIHLALYPDDDVATRVRFGKRGLTGEAGQRWELSRGALLYEQRDDRGNCWANGGIPIAAYTASLDVAMTLVPEGWFTFLATQDRHSLRWKWHLRGGFGVNAATRAATPALALAAAALRARAALAKETPDDV